MTDLLRELEQYASTPREDGTYPSDGECEQREAKLTNRTVEHTVTDKETGRTFNLTLVDGSLIRLQELNRQDPHPHFEDVSQDFPDGLSWWEQWENEVKAGAFNHSRRPT